LEPISASQGAAQRVSVADGLTAALTEAGKAVVTSLTGGLPGQATGG